MVVPCEISVTFWKFSTGGEVSENRNKLIVNVEYMIQTKLLFLLCIILFLCCLLVTVIHKFSMYVQTKVFLSVSDAHAKM
jgi:hypothetical protein